MPQAQIQVVWAHPRIDSLTGTIAQDVEDALRRLGVGVDVIDLYRSGFNGALREADEPDWDNIDRPYSDEVMDYASRTREADAVIFIFPVWWYSLPALLKGYIDRVWNHGIFYGGGRRSGLVAVRWIGLAGDSSEAFRKRRYDDMMAHHLNVGIAGFCGVNDSRLELLYNTLGSDVPDFSALVKDLRAAAIRTAVELFEQLPSNFNAVDSAPSAHPVVGAAAQTVQSPIRVSGDASQRPA